MKIKLLLIAFFAFLFSSCQFTETMELNSDGSGTMKVAVNMDQMMEIMKGMGTEKDQVKKMDTLIYVKDILEKKKDSISKLPKKDQEELKKMKHYKIHVLLDEDNSKLQYELIADFKNIAEMNNLSEAIGRLSDFAPMAEIENQGSDEGNEELIGIDFSFAENVFKRNAYIKDKVLHRQQMDSIKSMEGFLSTSLYSLNYTFPKKIKTVSNREAKISSDRKSVMIQMPFLEYYKNPDLLNIEVLLEK